jgi:hypothetical protein
MTPRGLGRRRAWALLWCASAVCGGLTLGIESSSTAPAAAKSAPRRTTSRPHPPLPAVGVNIGTLGPGSRTQDADRAIAQAVKLHATVVRTSVPWSLLEPKNSEISPRALAFTDRLVADASAAGIRVIMTAESSPCWASSAPEPLLRHCSEEEQSRAHAWPPRNPADYAAFVAYLARRYGAQLAGIEIWNEPDQINQLYFAGADKARRYATLLRAAYPAIKAASPAVPVLAGSLVGSNGIFLRALYAAGIRGYYDGLAVHYYGLLLDALRQIREVQLANGDSRPLWLDEFGWSSCWPRNRIQQEQACVTARTQATNLRDAIRSLARTPYVAAMVVYKLQSTRTEDFGLLSTSGARKPAFTAFTEALASPFGAVSRVSLGLRAHAGQLVARGSAPVGDLMQLEAWQEGVLRLRAVFTLDRFNRYSLALPAVLGTHGLRVRVYQWWAGPGRAAERTI